jgi:AraC-like DNA-binding protein
MLGEPSTLASVGVAVRLALAECGLDAESVFDDVGLDVGITKKHEARIPLSQATRLWARLVELTGDPAFGLVVARFIRPTITHALGQSLLASTSIADAVARIGRYDKTVTSGTELEVNPGATRTELFLRFPHSTIQPAPQGRDCMVALLMHSFRSLAGGAFRPLRVTLSHPDYGLAKRYDEVFGCEVLFNARRDGLSIDNKTLNQPCAYGNPELAREIDKISEQYLRKLDSPATSYRVQHLIQQGLPSGQLSQDEIAKRLNRSISSLRRDLHNEGTSYKSLLEETRETLAKAYIEHGRHSLAEVAYLLGFSDQANFTRAFRRWTGSTPSEFAGQEDAQ